MSTTVMPARTGDRRPSRLPLVVAVWTVLLVLGTWLVLALGGPVATSGDALAAAFDPPTPVTESVARSSADTIVRIAYPDFAGTEPRIVRSTDFDIDRYVLVYSRSDVLSGVRVSIEVESGDVQVSTFP